MIPQLQKDLFKPVIISLEFEIDPVKFNPDDEQAPPFKWVPRAKIGESFVYIAPQGNWITEKKDDALFARSEEGAQELIDSLKASL